MVTHGAAPAMSAAHGSRTGAEGGEHPVDLRQLRALVTVAEVGSVTRAAEVLRVMQPTVTRQIRILEQQFGATLFERTRQGMRPTEAGLIVVERARRALHQLERARAEIQPVPDAPRGGVTVGLLDSTGDLVAEPLVAAIARDHPGIRLHVVTAASQHLQRGLDDGGIDVTLLSDLRTTQTLHVHRLVRENLWAVAPASAELNPAQSVPLATAARQPLILPSTGHALRTLVDEAAARADVRPAIAVETNSPHVQRQLVLAGHGWTVLPGVAVADDVARGVLSAAPLCDPDVRRTVVLATPRGTRSPQAVRLVARELIRHVNHAVEHGRWPSATLYRPGVPMPETAPAVGAASPSGPV
ncbi:LysR family transcriptional regulator [Yinghuangia sp. ASG 101]|uniref:LysR family transcriptional regulator n=1 Tax=Yinghuangia sp. ASG 101 TaxID=2896848 RepID=UPI001E2BE5AA|nr:LysR family transcriptional regulator [Yinghuangia sp. ASG 101]UGQ12233.1 LysR family transcriptional regulator [Yinghuangia sp. ASG 101]